jgi:cytoskeleton protein RodZ
MEEKSPAQPPAEASATAPAAAKPEPAPGPRSIGERLRAGRERSGLSLPAAAEKLHLDPKVIEALEADRFAELGASVYVRGHLRRYGDFVGEPGAELVNLYTARDTRPPPPDLTQVPQAERRADPRRLVSPLVGVGCALVLGLAVWWILAGSAPDGAAPAESAVAVAPSREPAVTATAVAAPATIPAPAAAVPVASTPSAAKAAPTPGATATTPAATTPSNERPEAPVAPTQLTLQLSSESWVEVYDARGQRLFFDIASAGSVQSVQGRPPLRVVLGNAAGVAVQVNGQSRDIPAAAVDGEGARFVVNRSGTLSRSRQ